MIIPPVTEDRIRLIFKFLVNWALPAYGGEGLFL